MGLAATQMRMITLTKRQNDVEQKLMHNSNERLALSRKSAAISAEHSAALNATKLVYGTADSNTPISYSMFNNANLDYALTDSSGAVLVSSSDAAKWGLDATGQSTSMPDETTFISKASGVDATTVSTYLAGQVTEPTSSPSSTESLYTINYKDDSVFKELSNGSGTDANGTSFAYASSSDTSKVVDFSVKTGQTETMANLKNFTCTTVNDAGDALLAVLEENFGDNWDSVEDDMTAAATLAKQATINFYTLDNDSYNERTTGHSSCTIQYDDDNTTARVVTTGDDTDDDASAQKVASGSLNVGTGSSDQNSYVDTTEMVKYFLSQFDLYAAAISTGTISQDDVAAINTAASDDYTIGDISDKNFETYSAKVDDSKITNTNGSQKIKCEDNTIGSDVHLTIYGLKQNNRTSDTSNKCTVTGADESSSDKTPSTNDTIEYYASLYEEIAASGYKVNDNITNDDYLEDQISYGNIVIKDVSTGAKETIDEAASKFITIDDEEAADQADADYEAEKDKQDYKETILDTEQNNLDTERAAITTEKESVQKLLDSNVKKFSLFQNA